MEGWAGALCGQIHGLDLDHGQLSTNYESWPQDRCSVAARSAAECPHHGLQNLFLAHHVVQVVRLMQVLPLDHVAHRPTTWALEVDLWVGNCSILGLGEHSIR